MKFVNMSKEEFMEQKLLYKYMPLEQALMTLDGCYLWFANPTTWKDPFEKRFIDAKYMDGNHERNFLWKNRIFCICMTQTMVSEAAWQVYAQGKIGVQFRIYRDALLKELKAMEKDYNVYIGKAEYMKTDDIRRDLSKVPFNPPQTTGVNTYNYAARLLMLKRVAFQYEDEVRILLVSKDTKNTGYRKGVKMAYQCENTDLILRIVLDPNLEKMTYEMIKERLEDKYKFVSYNKPDDTKFNRVIQSAIYKDKDNLVIRF